MISIQFIDFFAGIGGFRRGMELAGHECVGFCEWDKFATASYTSMHLLTEEQRERLSGMDLKHRQKEILKPEYRNGEWYAEDIRTVRAVDLPAADCWCFGAPCQDFSTAGRRAGLQGERSSLVREIFRLLGEIPEENRPEWLLYENVRGMLSSNRGFDYLAILLEMDRGGYDCEWQLLDSQRHGVPQHRERVYVVGHLRRLGSAKVFPLKGTDGADHADIKQIGRRDRPGRENLNQYRVYSPDGCAPALNSMGGGGREPMVGLKVIGSTRPKKDNFGGDRERVIGIDGIAPSLRSTDYKEPIKIGVPLGVIESQGRTGRQCEIRVTVPTIRAQHHSHYPEVVLPVITPDRAEKRQNGRRFKENRDPAFTLTAQDRHGVAISVDVDFPEDHSGIYVTLENGVIAYAVWYEKEQCYIVIRKLTPKECFRLQGWTDDYFDRAQFVNSDSQLYEQAGNGVTVQVVRDVARKMEG